MRGVRRPEPKFLAVVTSLNAMRFSVRTEIPGSMYQLVCEVRTEIPGDISQFKREVFFGRNRHAWQYLPNRTRGVRRSDTKYLAVFTSLNPMRFAVRTETPGSFPQSKYEAFVCQNQNSWRSFPV